MRVTKGLPSFFAIGIMAIFVATTFGQDQRTKAAQDILGRLVTWGDLNDLTVMEAFSKALVATRVPGGVVVVENCNGSAKYASIPSGSSLGDALDIITLAEPRYRWELEGGVVNLVPTDTVPPFLSLRIAEFDVQNAKTVFEPLNRLLALPALQKRKAELNLTEGMTRLGLSSLPRPGFDANKDDIGFAVRCHEATVREILNAIVRAHGRAVWAYTERHCDGRNEFRINFLVQ